MNCALAVQEKLADDPESLRLHIGIHQSDIVLGQGEVTGDGVNIAARICALSEGDAPYISDEVQHAVQNQANLSFESLGEHEFKTYSPLSLAIADSNVYVEVVLIVVVLRALTVSPDSGWTYSP